MMQNLRDTDAAVVRKLADHAPFLILCYQDKDPKKTGEESDTYGILFATKRKMAVPLWLPIKIDAANGLEEDGDGEKMVAFVLCGIGNYGEILQLKGVIEAAITNEVQTLGAYPNFPLIVTSILASHINDNYRSALQIRPYGVELALVSILKDIHIFRIKYDGDLHPATPFCVLGGYQKSEGKHLRRKAMAICRKAYKKVLPTSQHAKRLAKQILGMAKNSGEYVESEIRFE